MPGYRAHLVGGSIAFSFIVVTFFSFSAPFMTALQWLGFSLVGALFPDIDIKSKGQLFFYRAMGILIVCLLLQKRFVDCALMSAIGFLPLAVKHRGLTHSFAFLLLVASSIMVYTAYCAPSYIKIVFWDLIFFLGGALSHLLLDFRLAVFAKRKR